MPDQKWSPLAEDIRLTIQKIGQLDAKIETQRKEMERMGLFSYTLDERVREQNRTKYEYLEDLTMERDAERQKRIGLELVSINSYSDQLNKNIQTLNESTKKLVKSSTKLEYLSTLLIIVATVNIAIVLVPLNPLYALVSILAGLAAMIQLWRRARRVLPKMNSQ